MKAWIAKDKDGAIYIYWDIKPHKDEISESWSNGEASSNDHIDNYSLFRDVAEGLDPLWEDREPIELNISITKA